MRSRFRKFFLRTPIFYTMTIPLCFSVLLIIVILIIPNTDAFFMNLRMILLSITFLSSGLAGFPMIVRQQAPGFLGKKGDKAAIRGYSLLFGSWILAVLILFGVIFMPF